MNIEYDTSFTGALTSSSLGDSFKVYDGASPGFREMYLLSSDKQDWIA
jgi:hypothetical protein